VSISPSINPIMLNLIRCQQKFWFKFRKDRSSTKMSSATSPQGLGNRFALLIIRDFQQNTWIKATV
jgi:hypothetical protein